MAGEPGHRFRVELFSNSHKPLRNAFSCGKEELDRYLKTQARQDAARRVATVWVLIDPSENRIAGYYTLSSHSVRLQELPETMARDLPRYPQVPVILLGRLARDLEYRGQGLGEILLVDALRRAYGASEQISAMGVVVHAKDDEARQFYEENELVPFPDNPRHLIMSMEHIRDL